MDMATGKISEFDVKAAKMKDPRDIEALILKNRNGATGITLNYHYYPRYNAYTEYERREAGSGEKKYPPEILPTTTEGRLPIE